MSRVIFEVIPVDGAWLVRIPGDSVAELQPTKSEAIERVRSIAERYDDWRARVYTDGGVLEAELVPSATPPESRRT
jgi:hypothetical protein